MHYTEENTRTKFFDAINEYKSFENIKEIDVVIATPPCQGMSVANHKKTANEINRNSLVVEAISLLTEIKPKIFIFENVRSFMNTACYDRGNKKKIYEAIFDNLADNYEYVDQIINFKNYGANSSRTRTLVIGVRKDLSKYLSPVELFPSKENETTLRDNIYFLQRLKKMGEVSVKDIYQNFKNYDIKMRSWIDTLSEGESAFDNKNPLKRPHRIIKGEIVENVSKNGDKYKRQYWDRVAPCIHTRNDIFASQNTIHPVDDRVFSIRELMILMNIPEKFKWVEESFGALNKLSYDAKRNFLRKHEINIRQSIGEAIPTIIMRKIAKNIKKAHKEINLNDREIKKIISKHNFIDFDILFDFLRSNINKYSMNTLSRFAELSNSSQNDTAAYYTDRNLLTAIYKRLPDIKKEKIGILEPAVGVGNFIPFIAKKYELLSEIVIDVYDIDARIIKITKLLIEKMNLPSNIKINYFVDDFLEQKDLKRYDLIIGNPPFLKLRSKGKLEKYRRITGDFSADNTSAFFLNKALKIADYVVMILPKYFLHNTDFRYSRELASSYAIEKILDFGEKGFKGILIETICVFISTIKRQGKTECVSMTHNFKNQLDQKAMCDGKFPNWLIYRNIFFDELSEKMQFDIFTCYRDRQISNKHLNKNGDVWIVKSRNILRDGGGIVHIKEYDTYINKSQLNKFSISKFIDRDDIYLTPNMTYYPRVVRKPKGLLVNGSVAILELKNGIILTDKDLKYFSSEEFNLFYKIARNYSTRSLNIDKNSIFYFAKKRG